MRFMTTRMALQSGVLIGLLFSSGLTPCIDRAEAQDPAPAERPGAADHDQPAEADSSDATEPVRPRLGTWRAWLESPGGELPFGLELDKDDRGRWRAWFINGEERMVVPIVSLIDNGIILAVDYYDASIVGKVNEDGTRLEGEWKKRGRGEKWPKLPFHATSGDAPRFPGDRDRKAGVDVSGRWDVKFSDSETPAVGVFEQKGDGLVTGTFLTPGGDYRFLAGDIRGNKLRLSAFDGAHAFLLPATVEAAASGKPAVMTGDFWSGDSYHVTWTAQRSGGDASAMEKGAEDAHLPEGFSAPDSEAKFSELLFKDLEGEKRVLSEPAFAGKARIIEVFGTWCPNCSDAARHLAELDARYRERGLSIVGLAFEYTGDFARDAKQVQRFAAAHGVAYPLLIGGVAEKGAVASALPFLGDGVFAYPTTIFLDADGRVHAIHTGYVGPASPEDHRKLRQQFERIIEELLLAADSEGMEQGDEEE